MPFGLKLPPNSDAQWWRTPPRMEEDMVAKGLKPPPPIIIVNRPSKRVSPAPEKPSRPYGFLPTLGNHLPPIIWTALAPPPMNMPPRKLRARSL
ncbi:hypothetical protein AFR_02500 [Actinoplanes friuliensis DSM 7358]|uniref:Uncharacterized protein n=1 Tax=Actinoplanes friuliensis DSM 7358 TaxID=1246995 RepID=U5VPQ9_9ACTN|nr:hypothetical protein AFR_02500 [Actinoplanes friuliensis DSM 7358]